MRDILSRHDLLISDIVKSVISVCLLIFLGYYKSIFSFTFTQNFFSMIATLSGTLAGFVLVGMSIIYTLPSEGVLKKLKQLDSFKQSYDIYYMAFLLFLIVMILSIFGWSNMSGHAIFGWIVLSLFATSLWFVYRCFWILKNIVDLRSIDD